MGVVICRMKILQSHRGMVGVREQRDDVHKGQD